MGAQGPSPEFDAAVERFWKAGIGGVLVVVPGTVGAALGASTAVLFGYLCVVIVVLTVVVVRRRTQQ